MHPCFLDSAVTTNLNTLSVIVENTLSVIIEIDEIFFYEFFKEKCYIPDRKGRKCRIGGDKKRTNRDLNRSRFTGSHEL